MEEQGEGLEEEEIEGLEKEEVEREEGGVGGGVRRWGSGLLWGKQGRKEEEKRELRKQEDEQDLSS